MPDSAWWAKVAADGHKRKLALSVTDTEAQEMARALRNHASYLRGYTLDSTMCEALERIAGEIEKGIEK